MQLGISGRRAVQLLLIGVHNAFYCPVASPLVAQADVHMANNEMEEGVRNGLKLRCANRMSFCHSFATVRTQIGTNPDKHKPISL